jgi:hypothetical protein
LKITINSVNVENVVKGKARYNKATVGYTYNGEARTQNIMDFANPSIFKQVQGLVAGDEIDVTLTKNAQGYSEWASIATAGSAPSGSPAPASTTTRVTGSNYETAEERAKKQVYIIKQSSISNAIALLSAQGTGFSEANVIDAAQFFTDWVLDNPKE